MATPDLIVQMLLAFGAVLALMGLLAVVAKKFSHRIRPGAQSGLAVQATLSLGSREKLVVVAYAGREYLLGVTAQGISAIDAAPAPPATRELSAVEHSS